MGACRVADEQPTGSCVCCHRRDPHEGYACNPCRSRLRSWLGELPDLYTHLLDEPLAPSGSPGKGGPVTGSRDRPIPIRVDLFDLTHAGAQAWLEGEDQVGHIPVWMTLETWARDWSTFRNMGEAADRTVPGLCRWMWERVDDLCDEHDAIDEAFTDIRRLYGAMRTQLGMVDVPDYKKGVPCRQCNALALVRRNGEDFIECGECPAVLTPEEYDAWVRGVAAAAKKMEKAA
jgi:hypothetical protein